MFQGGNAAQHSNLYIFGQAGIHALYIDFTGTPALRLQENLVGALIGKTHNFIFNGGTIARTNAFDHPSVER